MFLMVAHCEVDRGNACDMVVDQINKSYELLEAEPDVLEAQRMFRRNIPRLFMRYDELHCDRIGR
tara:strand:+ start:1439 stop:1633 length:195 start_codon:yes stop_codon:yes gene_type:complete